MNKQRKVLITITYNEMGIIIDTKAEEVAQPDKDMIHLQKEQAYMQGWADREMTAMPSAQLEVLACGSGELDAQPEQRWIPCSERLPEENIPVLLGVRFKDDFKYFVTARLDYNYWTNLGRDIRGEMRWMPLPDPYKEDES